MKKKRSILRINLDEDDVKTLEEIREITGIKGSTDLFRFALKTLLNKLKKIE